MRVPLGKEVWAKSLVILLAGLFFIESSAYALKPVESVTVLQDEDYTGAILGLVASIALPCVGNWATSIGTAYNLGTLTTTAIGVGMGAAIGAMPGIVADNSRAATWGAISGGIGGGWGTYNHCAAIHSVNNEINRLGSQMSQINGLTPVTQDMVDSSGMLANSGCYNEAAFNLSQASNTIASSSSLVPLAEQLTNVSNACSTLGTELQTYAARISTAITTQQVSQVLTQAAVLSWGMHPKDAQFLGMVGGSTTNWTLNAAVPNGQDVLQGMYKGTCMENLAKNSPVAAGAITGLGLGSVQSAVNIGLYDALDGGDIKNTSARGQLASLGGSVLGSMAWGGIINGVEALLPEGSFKAYTTEAGFPEYTSPTLTMLENDSKQMAQHSDKSMLATVSNVAVDFAKGVGQGIKDSTVQVDWKGVGRQALTMGTTYVAERNMVDKNMSPAKTAERQAYASIVGQTAGMLLAHAPIWPETAKPEEAKQARKEAQVNRDYVRDTDSYSRAYRQASNAYNEFIDSGGKSGDGQAWGPLTQAEFNRRTTEVSKQDAVKAYTTEMGFSDYTSPTLAGLENKSKQLVACKIWENKRVILLKEAEELEAKGNRLDGFHLAALREPTVITDSRKADAFLEPILYGLADLAVTELRMDKQGAAQVMHDWTVMNISQLSHSAAVALVNQKGWKEGFGEFGQIYQLKQCEVYDDMMPFASLGKSAFGISNKQKDEDKQHQGSMYMASLMNDQVWNFTGVARLDAQAEGIDNQLSEQGEDFRRMILARSIPNSFFEAAGSAISSPTGGLAKYHTVRNMEAAAYTLVKIPETFRPTLVRVNKNLSDQLQKEGNVDAISGLNRWIKESAYPAYFNPGEGGIRFSSWAIGIKDEKLGSAKESRELKVENTISGIQSPLNRETLEELDVNRPFDYKFPPFSRNDFASVSAAIAPIRPQPAGPKLEPPAKLGKTPNPSEGKVNQSYIPEPRIKQEEKNNADNGSFISIEDYSRTKSEPDTLFIDPHQPAPNALDPEKNMLEGYEVVRPLGEGVYELKKEVKWQNDPHYIGVMTDNGLEVHQIYEINDIHQQNNRMDMKVGYVDGTTGKVSVDLNTKAFLGNNNREGALTSAFKWLMR